MPIPVRSIRLSKTQSEKLNNLTGEGGELFYDYTNETLRIFDGKSTVGSILATQSYVSSQIPQSLTDLGITDGTEGQVLTTDGNGNFTFEDSTGSSGSISADITGITQANPGVVTTDVAHGLGEGQAVTITDVVGMIELNGNEYYADVISSTSFAIYSDLGLTTPVDTSAMTAYVSDGVATGESTAGVDLSAFSVTQNPASGTGTLSYSNGVFTYTPPDTSTFATTTDIADFITANDLANYGYVTSGDLTGYVTNTDLAGYATLAALSDYATLGALSSYATTTALSTATANSANWDTAFSWGNHASAGYLTSVTETDTLDTVTGRGNTTANNISVGNVTSSGTISADDFVSTGVGTPTLSSASTLNLNAADGIICSGSPFRLPVLTDTQRNALTPVNGDLIYNSTSNKIEGYQNGSWIEIDTGAAA